MLSRIASLGVYYPEIQCGFIGIQASALAFLPRRGPFSPLRFDGGRRDRGDRLGGDLAQFPDLDGIPTRPAANWRGR